MRGAVVLVAAAVGVLFAVGLGISVLFELQGFGGPRDEGPRTGYLAVRVLGIGAALGIPLLLWRLLLPQSSPGWVLAAVPLLVAVVVVLGLSVGR